MLKLVTASMMFERVVIIWIVTSDQNWSLDILTALMLPLVTTPGSVQAYRHRHMVTYILMSHHILTAPGCVKHPRYIVTSTHCRFHVLWSCYINGHLTFSQHPPHHHHRHLITASDYTWVCPVISASSYRHIHSHFIHLILTAPGRVRSDAH